jgi:hypothetical protein
MAVPPPHRHRQDVPIVTASQARSPRASQHDPPRPDGGRGRGSLAVRHLARFARDEQLILAIVALTFVARLMLAGWNSYWLDELLSVDVYGRDHDTLLASLRWLAAESIHPPLYQGLLYPWMQVFGDSEVSTRTLSNVFVSAATLAVYLPLVRPFGRRVALLSAITFTLAYTPTYYGLETRSYGLTILLAAVSSACVLRLVRRVDRSTRIVELLASPAAWGLVVANAALLLTHYYNLFFWAAQAVFVCVFLLVRRGWRGAGSTVMAAAGLTGLPIVAFLLIWGRIFRRQFAERAGTWEIEGEPHHPLELLWDSTVAPNLQAPRVVAGLGGAILLVLLVRSVRDIVRAADRSPRGDRAWSVVYLCGWLVAPFAVLWASSAVLGVERYEARYFVYVAPALGPLLVLAVREGWGWVRHVVGRLSGGDPLRPYERSPAGLWVTALLVALLVVPGGRQAAVTEKDDWRGLGQRAAQIVERHGPDNVRIYEVGHFSSPMIDRYVEPASEVARVEGVIQHRHEVADRLDLVFGDVELAGPDELLVVLFPHLRVMTTPNTIAYLDARFERHLVQLDRSGRGMLIYRGPLTASADASVDDPDPSTDDEDDT